jgi:hypothetical protein
MAHPVTLAVICISASVRMENRSVKTRAGQARASLNRAINPEYLRVGEVIAFSNTSAPATIVTLERARVTAV